MTPMFADLLRRGIVTSDVALRNPPRPPSNIPLQPMSPSYAMNKLQSLGFSKVQAATIVGNMQQESSLDPGSINGREGAHGLLQWRDDPKTPGSGRWTNLQKFAADKGTSWNDPDTQMEFIAHEMKNDPYENKQSQAFRNATTLEEANSAIKQYVRYGDAPSESARLANSQFYAAQPYGAKPAEPARANAMRTAQPAQAYAQPDATMTNTAGQRAITGAVRGQTPTEMGTVAGQTPGIGTVRDVKTTVTTPEVAPAGYGGRASTWKTGQPTSSLLDPLPAKEQGSAIYLEGKRPAPGMTDVFDPTPDVATAIQPPQASPQRAARVPAPATPAVARNAPPAARAAPAAPAAAAQPEQMSWFKRNSFLQRDPETRQYLDPTLAARAGAKDVPPGIAKALSDAVRTPRPPTVAQTETPPAATPRSPGRPGLPPADTGTPPDTGFGTLATAPKDLPLAPFHPATFEQPTPEQAFSPYALRDQQETEFTPPTMTSDMLRLSPFAPPDSAVSSWLPSSIGPNGRPVTSAPGPGASPDFARSPVSVDDPRVQPPTPVQTMPVQPQQPPQMAPQWWQFDNSGYGMFDPFAMPYGIGGIGGLDGVFGGFGGE